MNHLDDRVLGVIAGTNPVASVDPHAPLSPDAISMRDRIIAVEPRRAARRRLPDVRRRRNAVGAGVLGVLVAGGVAVAVGVTPPGVTRAIHSVSPSGTKVTDAKLLVESVSKNGIRDQFWTARNSAGQSCFYERTVAPDGREDGAVGCFTVSPDDPRPPVDKLTGGLSAAGRPWPSLSYEVLAHTTLTTVAGIELVYPNDNRYRLTFNRGNGWAIGVVPPSVTTLPSTLVGLDEYGAVVVEKHLAPTTGG